MQAAAAVAREWMPFNATIRWKQPHVPDGVVDTVKSKLFGGTEELHQVYAGQGMSGFLTNYDEVKVGARLLDMPRFVDDRITSARIYGASAGDEFQAAIPHHGVWHDMNWGGTRPQRSDVPGMAQSWDEMNAKVASFETAPNGHVLVDLSINSARGVWSGPGTEVPEQLAPLVERARTTAAAVRGFEGEVKVGKDETLLDGLGRLAGVIRG